MSNSRPDEHFGEAPPPPRPRIRLGPAPLDELAGRDVEWLWPGRIALGHVTLLVGDPGVGKSLLALDLAARLSTGAPWPEAGECGMKKSDVSAPPPPPSPFPTPHSALILSAEDDLADTVRPRLAAAGADCRRIFAFGPSFNADDPWGEPPVDTSIPDLRPAADRGPASRPFDLRRDLPLLDSIIGLWPDCRLVVLDPLSAYLSGVENLNAEARRMLAPLAALAARRGIAVLAVSHLRKSPGSAIHRAIGSLAFVAAARSTWLLAADRDRPERRVLAPLKNNLGPGDAGLSFTVAAAPGGAPTIRWDPAPVRLTADDVLRESGEGRGRASPERDDAIRWLTHTLAAGPLPAAQVHEFADAHGLRRTTMRRAFRELRGVAFRTGFGDEGQWHWRLPGYEEAPPGAAGASPASAVRTPVNHSISTAPAVAALKEHL